MQSSNTTRGYTIPEILVAHYDAMETLDRWAELCRRGYPLPPTEVILETLTTWANAMHSFSLRRSVNNSTAEKVLISKCAIADKNIRDAMTL